MTPSPTGRENYAATGLPPAYLPSPEDDKETPRP
jgi:hypothetical protein